jgi:hypothetical protein
MLREVFGETDFEESRPQSTPNNTPLFRLAEVMPEFVDELSQLLAEQGQTALAAGVADLRVFDRCRCESDYCATIYTRPKHEGAYPDRGGLSVFTKAGPVHIDTSEGQIACIEALDQPAVRSKLLESLP